MMKVLVVKVRVCASLVFLNEVERLFSRRKGFGRTFSLLDQLDRMFSAFWFLVLIVDSLR